MNVTQFLVKTAVSVLMVSIRIRANVQGDLLDRIVKQVSKRKLTLATGTKYNARVTVLESYAFHG